MKVSNPFKTISDLWRYYGYYCKARKVQSDWNKMKAKWTSIGGINADTELLLDFLNEYALLCVEYATWTPTTLDDKGIAVIRYILTTHRSLVTTMINAVRTGKEFEPSDLANMAFAVGIDSNNVGVPPLTVLGILINIYQALLLLKKEDTETPPVPDTTPPTPEPKRPIINFIRAIFKR
jgi:hypothetical protein